MPAERAASGYAISPAFCGRMRRCHALRLEFRDNRWLQRFPATMQGNRLW